MNALALQLPFPEGTRDLQRLVRGRHGLRIAGAVGAHRAEVEQGTRPGRAVTCGFPVGDGAAQQRLGREDVPLHIQETGQHMDRDGQLALGAVMREPVQDVQKIRALGDQPLLGRLRVGEFRT